MTYSAKYHARAAGGIKHASSEMRKRIKLRTEERRENPYLGTRMVGSEFYESRAGSRGGAYRMVHAMDRDVMRITAHDIGRHKILGC